MADGRREVVAAALVTVVGDFGWSLPAARVRALLNDVLGTEARPAQAEVNAAVAAADAGVPAALHAGTGPAELGALVAEGGVEPELALWAVGAWAAAMADDAATATVPGPTGGAAPAEGAPSRAALPPPIAAGAAAGAAGAAGASGASGASGATPPPPAPPASSPSGGAEPPVEVPVDAPDRRRRLVGTVVAAAIVAVVAVVVIVAIAVRSSDSGSAAGPDTLPPSTTAAPAATTTTTAAMDTTTTMPMVTTTAMDMPGTTVTPTTTDPMASHGGGGTDMTACADPGAGGLKATITESAIELSGSVGDDGQKAALHTAVPLRQPLDEHVMVASPAPSAAAIAAFTQVLPGLDENLVTGNATVAGDMVCVSGAFIDDTARADLTAIVDGLKAQGAMIDSHVAQHDMSGELHVHDLQVMLNRLAAKKQVPFAEASADLDPNAGPTLDYISNQVIKRFSAYPNLVVEVKGYTDSVGSDESNLQLSMARADRVKDELIARGVAPEQIQAMGYGESDPVATNETPEGREMNRRVVFGVLHAGDAGHMG